MNVTTYTSFFTPDELVQHEALKAQLASLAGDCLQPDEVARIEALLTRAVEEGSLVRDSFGLNPLISNLSSAYCCTIW